MAISCEHGNVNWIMLGIFSLPENHTARLFVLVINFILNPESRFSRCLPVIKF
jgi:hypothetical protein